MTVRYPYEIYLYLLFKETSRLEPANTMYRTR
jgi:hypothetical protein